MRAGLRFFAIAAFLLLVAAPAAAEKRVALVIGNNDYASLGPDEQLRKAVNDANAVGDALEAIGFEVNRGENLSRGALLASLFTMANMLDEGDVAFFFYAGHGVSIDGANYLLPADIPPADSGAEDLVKASAVPESMIVETLKGRGVRVAVVVLDACRDNPFSQGGTRAFGDATRGLSRPPAVQIQGVFGLYSAGFGERALDRLSDDDPNPNSVFTRILIPALQTPGQSLLDIAYEVNEEVANLAETIGHQQNPAYYDQARARDIFLAGEAEEPPPEEPVVATTDNERQIAVTRSDSCEGAQLHFEAAREIGRVEALEDHIRTFGQCQYAALAQMLIEGMDKPKEEEVAVLTTEDSPSDVVEAGPGDSDPIVAECERTSSDVAFDETYAEAAIRACEQANTRRPNDAYIMMLLGQAYYGAQKYAHALKWLQLSAELGDRIAQNKLGTMYDRGEGVAENDTEAARWFRMAAEQGYDLAQMNLGVLYAVGSGVELSDTEAVKWYRLAAEQGLATAQNALGAKYDYGQGVTLDDVEAVKWYRLAADQGLADAQYNLGLMYDYAEGVPDDDAEAAKWYRLAAEQGLASAQNSLGLKYDYGQGVTLDDVEAVKWYRLAAEQGLASAQNNLGLMYDYGEGVPNDKVEAARWYRMAADQGDATAQYNLGSKYDAGAGVPLDDVEAVRWYRLSADQGNADAQNALGLMYDYGEGVTLDDKEAVTWYRLAADQGHSAAQNNLGLKYDYGEGVPLDDAEAVKWYRLAADQGYAAAQNNLGLMYDYGEGVTIDDFEAVRWFQAAADQGHSGGQYNLGLMYEFGEGVSQADDVQAVAFYKLAEAQSHANATWALGKMYSAGRGGLPLNVTLATDYFLKALRLQSAEAKRELIENRARSFSATVRREIQNALRAQGAYSGSIDGVFGPATVSAIEQYANGG